MAAWWLDKVLPGLIDAIPFIIIVGFGAQWHKRTLAQANEEANEKQTEELVTKTDEQTQQIVGSLKGPPQ